jgi:hypothetical protein
MLTFIVAPPTAPRVDPFAAAGVQHPLAREVIDALRQRGSAPVSMWRFVNELASERGPGSRTQARYLKINLLKAIRVLLAAKLIYRHRGQISFKEFAFMPRPRSRARLSSSVARSTSKPVGSNHAGPERETVVDLPQVSHREVNAGPAPMRTRSNERESAPAPELASEAARQLALLPRRPKRTWSGWVGPTRTFCGMRIKLRSTGESAFVFGTVRGRVVWSRQPGDLTDPIGGIGQYWGVVAVRDVEIVKNPHAVALGRMKAGKVERKSEAKARAARLNGTWARRRA